MKEVKKGQNSQYRNTKLFTYHKSDRITYILLIVEGEKDKRVSEGGREGMKEVKKCQNSDIK